MTDDVEEVPNATCKRETAKAILVSFGKASKYTKSPEVWVPKSVVHDDSEVYKEGDTGTLIVARWFAEKEGLG